MAFLPIKQRGCLKYLTPTCPSPKGVFRFCHICILGISGNLCSISFTCHHLPIYIMFYLSACITVSHKCCISSHTSPRYRCPSSFGLACCITWVGERKFARFASWKFVHWQSHVKNVVGAKNSRQIQFLKESKNHHSWQRLLWTSILHNKELRRKRMHSSTHRSQWPAGKKTASKAIRKQWNLRRSARQCIWLYQYSTELKHRNEGKVHLSILYQFLQPKHISRNSGKSIVPFPSQSTSLIMSCKTSRTATNNRL